MQKTFKSFKRPPPQPAVAVVAASSAATNPLSAEDWRAADEYAAKLDADFSRRAELMKRRLDVTVDSFLWSERVSRLSDQVAAVYNPRRKAIAGWQPVGVSDVLGATEGELLQ